MADSKAPPSFTDGISDAMQAIAGAMAAPDADIHFGGEILKLLGTYVQSKHAPHGPQAAGVPAGGGAATGGPGAAGGPTPGTPGPSAGGPPASPASPAPTSIPGGQGSAGNPSQPNLAPPSGPTPPGAGGGLSQGLTPNPDELRRVLQESAGQ